MSVSVHSKLKKKIKANYQLLPCNIFFCKKPFLQASARFSNQNYPTFVCYIHDYSVLNIGYIELEFYFQICHRVSHSMLEVASFVSDFQKKVALDNC